MMLLQKVTGRVGDSAKHLRRGADPTGPRRGAKKQHAHHDLARIVYHCSRTHADASLEVGRDPIECQLWATTDAEGVSMGEGQQTAQIGVTGLG
jgi:hypothetical protein